MTDRLLLNVAETAHEFRCDRKTLYKRIQQGIYTPPIPGTKPPKWNAADVAATIAALAGGAAA